MILYAITRNLKDIIYVSHSEKKAIRLAKSLSATIIPYEDNDDFEWMYVAFFDNGELISVREEDYPMYLMTSQKLKSKIQSFKLYTEERCGCLELPQITDQCEIKVWAKSKDEAEKIALEEFESIKQN
jgi:Cu2+-containing amine oxidase